MARRIAAGEALTSAVLGLGAGVGFFLAGRSIMERLDIAGISVLLALEQGSLGMSTGHAETITYVEEFLRRLEGERRNA